MPRLTLTFKGTDEKPPQVNGSFYPLGAFVRAETTNQTDKIDL